jgi:hypothetical protein
MLGPGLFTATISLNLIERAAREDLFPHSSARVAGAWLKHPSSSRGT